MKIGILTQPLRWNYGGIIQNWALQQVLRRMGHEPEMIFLELCEHSSAKLQVMRSLSFVKTLVKKYLFGQKCVYLHSPFDPRYKPNICYYYADSKFVKCIHKTAPLGYNVDLTRITNRRGYEAFVVGSDQVWREEYSPRIQSYFLDFMPEDDKRKRIAYAASFGKERDYISPEKMPECSRLLGRFDAVSVREAEGVDIVRRDFDRHQVEKVLDPTLLLSATDYEALIAPDDRHSSPYIASYILDPDYDKTTILTQLATDKNLPISEISIDIRPEGMPTVSQWLANFADADFVVTDSFHGCVFSIIFGKPFIAIANAERGLGRFVSLLSEFGLMSRLVYNFDDFSPKRQHLLEPLDYSPVHQRHDVLRHHSLSWLKNALEK